MLLLFLVILAVSVCLYRSFCCSSNGFVLVLTTQKYKYLVLTLPVCVVLAHRIFFTAFKVVFCSCHIIVVFLAVLCRASCCFFSSFFALIFCSLNLIMHCFGNVYFCCAVNVVFVVFLGLLRVLVFSLCVPPWSCMPNTASPVPFRAPPRPLSVSLRSPTPICTLPTHVGALTLSSLTHIWLCLCSCLCVFLHGCWPRCVCPCGCDCAC